MGMPWASFPSAGLRRRQVRCITHSGQASYDRIEKIYPGMVLAPWMQGMHSHEACIQDNHMQDEGYI